jgi:hypothetical protein
MSPKEALIAARDVLAKYTFAALPYAPATIRFFDAIARAMLVIDKSNNYQYNMLMNDVFINRGILRLPVRPMVSINWEEYKTVLTSTDEVFDDPQVKAVRSKNTEFLSLPSYMMNVEAPGDSYSEFDNFGDCVNVVTASAEELIEHAHNCVEFLKRNDLIRPDKVAPFELDQDGNLVRSNFSCGCAISTCNCPYFACGCINNAYVFGQPEFGKSWKQNNNNGCGCNTACKRCSCSSTASENVVVSSRNTR